MLQASSCRSGKQEQEQNSQKIGTVFQLSPVACTAFLIRIDYVWSDEGGKTGGIHIVGRCIDLCHNVVIQRKVLVIKSTILMGSLEQYSVDCWWH